MKSKQSVCHITSVHRAFDNRIFHKECKSLVAAGYDVTLIAQNDKNELIEGVRIVSLPKIKNRISRILGLTFLALIYSIKQKAQIYHFHDPELIPICLILKMLRRKVIFDVHELVFYHLQEKKWLKFPFIIKASQCLYALFERLAVRYFDVIILAEEGYLPYFQGKYPQNVNKLRVIRNFPVIELIDQARPLAIKKKPAIIYVGVIGTSRSVKEMIQMMTYIKDEAELWLLGSWESDELKKECERLAGWQYVKDMGFRAVEEIYAYIKTADIALIIYTPVINNLTTLPVKTFEYMTCSIPFVQSNFPFWTKLFHGAALSAKPDDPEDIAKQVKILLHDSTLRREMGQKGREIVINNKYSWEMERKHLWEIYRTLLLN